MLFHPFVDFSLYLLSSNSPALIFATTNEKCCNYSHILSLSSLLQRSSDSWQDFDSPSAPHVLQPIIKTDTGAGRKLVRVDVMQFMALSF